MPVICVTVLKSICPIAKPNSHIEFIPAVLTAIVIAIASLWEQPQEPPAFAINDKLVHGVLYAMLAISMIAAVSRDARTRVLPYIYTCVIATSYGALLEILQRFCTLTRSGEMADLYADAIGAIIGVLLVCIFEIMRSRHLES
jgi:VanZ family protein